MKLIYQFLRDFLTQYFDLQEDTDSHAEIDAYFRNSIIFKGTNLWILIFAIMVASVGLNVNSPAVVIGAMLISPVMGPIMGIGYGIGIYDMDLIKTAARNLFIAVVISVTTSTVYFLVSPLGDAQSELLARTSPTVWDVLIAFFGGLAGIVTITRKSKGLALAGVAIATALMPPLCTAGFGVAKGNFQFFAGAAYLFFINSVFIATATILIVRFLRIPPKTFLDPQKQNRMRNYVLFTVLITLIPSVYFGFDIVSRGIFRKKVDQFIEKELTKEGVYVLSKKVDTQKNTIEVHILGSPFASEIEKSWEQQLKEYGLAGSTLRIKYGFTSLDNTSGILLNSAVQEKSATQTDEVNVRLREIEAKLQVNAKLDSVAAQAMKEVNILFPQIKKMGLQEIHIYSDAGVTDTTLVLHVKSEPILSKSVNEKLLNWIKIRTNEEKIILHTLPNE
ncbi:MAG: DUF389 domain-containing protein [Spirosomataceae bacterium]